MSFYRRMLLKSGLFHMITRWLNGFFFSNIVQLPSHPNPPFLLHLSNNHYFRFVDIWMFASQQCRNWHRNVGNVCCIHTWPYPDTAIVEMVSLVRHQSTRNLFKREVAMTKAWPTLLSCSFNISSLSLLRIVVFGWCCLAFICRAVTLCSSLKRWKQLALILFPSCIGCKVYLL